MEIDDLRAPPSPAFVLLGVEPASVERPATPKALATSLFSATGNPDLIPRDYALDFAPYWLFPHPDLSFDEFTDANVGQSIVQTLSVSLATSQIPATDSLEVGTGVGVGLRSLIVGGRPASAIGDTASGLRHQLLQIQDSILNADTVEEEDRLIEAARVVALEIQREIRRPVGFLLDAAAGLTVLFPENRFDDAGVGRIGAWVTPSFRIEHPQLDVIGVGRYQREDALGQDLWDFGARLLFELGDLALSAEYVGRLQSGQGDPENTERYAILADYRISESRYITASFGKNYVEPDGKEPLIAFLGINLGFGAERTVGLR